MDIGGNIAGLEQAGRTMTGVTEDIRGCGDQLSSRVEQLINDAGWNGDAAVQFVTKWHENAGSLDELADCVALAGSTLSTLAQRLGAAQREFDQAVSDALDAKVPVAADSSVPEGVYPDDVLAALERYQTARDTAFKDAKSAREAATDALHAIVMATQGKESEFFNAADVMALGTLGKGLYTVPDEYRLHFKEELDKFDEDYSKSYNAQRVKAGVTSLAEDDLDPVLEALRKERGLRFDRLGKFEALASHFKGGEGLNVKLGQILAKLGANDRLATGLADAIPGIDVVTGALATWAQANEDHQKGWSWGHALLVDGASNAAAIGAGMLTTRIPVAGIFLAPISSYGVGAYVYEAGHSGHWTKNIDEHGFVKGSLDSFGEAGKATWDEDIWGELVKGKNEVMKPIDGAKSLWHNFTSKL